MVAVARLRHLSPQEANAVEPLGIPKHFRPRALLFAGLAGSAVLVTFRSLGGALTAAATAVCVYLLMSGPKSAEDTASRFGTVLGRLAVRLGRGTDPDPRVSFAIDLLAVCLRGGMATSAALGSVAAVLTGVVEGTAGRGGASHPDASVVFAGVAAATELGSEPATAWRPWVEHAVYGQLARALIVTGESGSAVAARLESVAKQLRIAGGYRATARAQRAGVALMAPLGLCFLPAFVCLGVVPVVVGIAGQVFG